MTNLTRIEKQRLVNLLNKMYNTSLSLDLVEIAVEKGFQSWTGLIAEVINYNHRCEETLGMIGSQYLRCGAPAKTLVQHRGRNEGPYWMCDEHAHHNIHNRNAEDITPRKAQ